MGSEEKKTKLFTASQMNEMFHLFIHSFIVSVIENMTMKRKTTSLNTKKSVNHGK